jgi:aminoglycoside phosphotransferase family enzyme/predicted kinase
MELPRLIEALSDPRAYPVPATEVIVHQTHISVVFLAGPFAYKIKKPVDLGFLDFRTPERRRHFCEEEVWLNRRLAPSVYLGVVPVTRAGEAVRVEGDGEVVDWAVKMTRLPDDATLKAGLERNAVGAELIEALSRRVARFHAAAETNAHVASFGRFEVVAGNVRENFEQSSALVGTTVSPAVFARLRERTEAEHHRLRSVIEQRAARGVPRDTHGDLRLEHVYSFPERTPPNDLVIIDCIEFNERFRYADPVADVAFLVMDLLFYGHGDLARALGRAYFREAADKEGEQLLPFYTAYRAAVRAKVEGFELSEKEIPESEREVALVRARAHWLLALGELVKPGRRPCLVLVGGLPGTGKSKLARGLAGRAEFSVVRSDVVRKELAAGAGRGEDIYSPAWTERTYAECLRRAERLLFEGGRVILDATFREEKRRRAGLETARRWGVPGMMLLCRADPAAVRERLASRRGDASDADWEVYRQVVERWEEPGPQTRAEIQVVDTSGGPEESLRAAMVVLSESGLSDAA